MYSSSEVKVGKVCIGGNNPICVQSMTTTNTLDTVATVNQITELFNTGCEIVRVTTRSIKEAKNLKLIKELLFESGIDIPLVADVHFNPEVAEVAAQYCEKVRVNPGNYYGSTSDYNDEDAIDQRLSPLLDICKKHGTAIRIGVNHGSLSESILERFGNTALGMVESLMAFINVCEKYDFHNIILALKASNVSVMIESNILLVERLNQLGKTFPIHLGVTEAGSDEEGRIKSAVGIGYLLSLGIGDTIRVSLAEDPVNEIPIAKQIVNMVRLHSLCDLITLTESIEIPYFGYQGKGPVVITKNKSLQSDISFAELSEAFLIDKPKTLLIRKFIYKGNSVDELMVEGAIVFAISLINKPIDGVYIEADGISNDKCASILKIILQVLGLRISNAEYVACPTCGRTQIGLVDCLRELKEKTSHLIGLKLAVMGCIVNGPGEMAGADYGIVGSSINKVKLYKGNKVVAHNIPQAEAVDKLILVIKENGDW